MFHPLHKLYRNKLLLGIETTIYGAFTFCSFIKSFAKKELCKCCYKGAKILKLFKKLKLSLWSRKLGRERKEKKNKFKKDKEGKKENSQRQPE